MLALALILEMTVLAFTLSVSGSIVLAKVFFQKLLLPLIRPLTFIPIGITIIITFTCSFISLVLEGTCVAVDNLLLWISSVSKLISQIHVQQLLALVPLTPRSLPYNSFTLRLAPSLFLTYLLIVSIVIVLS